MNKYKNILVFLGKFFGTYFLFFALYAIYLDASQDKDNTFQCDPLTSQVANHTVAMLTAFNYDAESVQHTQERSMKIFLNEQYVARVIEGCNSVSVVILFAAFVIAFTGPFKATLIYILMGSAFIYLINVLRISFLTVMLYEFPKQQVLLHNLVFPGIIYGATFLLWIIWVQKFSQFKNE